MAITFSITLLIILATSIVSLVAFQSPKMIGEMVFYPARMQGGKELYRFLTHGLIHADFLHLFFNMLTLYFFGPVVEKYILNGPVFILLYISALVVSSLFDFFRHRQDYHYRSLGASGAVSAVVFAIIITDPWVTSICLFGVLCLPNIVFGILYIAYSQYMGKKGTDNIGHYAHLWGSLYGFVFTAIARPDLLSNFLDRLIHPNF
jgi:membrane associated rhomboid family serine protease